jgi:hypothetical protein
LPNGSSTQEFPAIGTLSKRAIKGPDAQGIADYGLRCLLTGVAASIESA